MESQPLLTDYVEWKYTEQDNLPTCSFSVDAGLGYFDSDFMESVFAAEKEGLIQKIHTLSFVENFKDELMLRMNNMDMTNMTAVISLTGKKGPGNEVNEKLFDFKSSDIRSASLQFVGAFSYNTK